MTTMTEENLKNQISQLTETKSKLISEGKYEYAAIERDKILALKEELKSLERE